VYNTCMVRKILTAQDPRLRHKSKPVIKIDKKILKLLEDMHDTLRIQKDPEGVGLAAPQIGEFYQIFLMRDENKTVPVFNPKIVKLSKKNNDPIKNQNDEYVMEGCLSLPHYYGPVQRSWTVELEYQKPKLENGEWILENKHEVIDGFAAQIIQHEVDHLNGKIFVDKLFEQNRQLFRRKNNEWVEVELP